MTEILQETKSTHASVVAEHSTPTSLAPGFCSPTRNFISHNLRIWDGPEKRRHKYGAASCSATTDVRISDHGTWCVSADVRCSVVRGSTYHFATSPPKSVKNSSIYAPGHVTIAQVTLHLTGNKPHVFQQMHTDSVVTEQKGEEHFIHITSRTDISRLKEHFGTNRISRTLYWYCCITSLILATILMWIIYTAADETHDTKQWQQLVILGLKFGGMTCDWCILNDVNRTLEGLEQLIYKIDYNRETLRKTLTL
jgi:hypothetical protein